MTFGAFSLRILEKSEGDSVRQRRRGETPVEQNLGADHVSTINYCFSLCLVSDAPGANSMRNVIAVTAAVQSVGAKTFTTRSVSFTPPVLDCQACCLPNGSCTDTVPAACGSAGGLARGTGT